MFMESRTWDGLRYDSPLWKKIIFLYFILEIAKTYLFIKEKKYISYSKWLTIKTFVSMCGTLYPD